MVTCFAAAVGDFDFFIPCKVQVSSAKPDGNVAGTETGICCSFHFSDSVLREAGSGELWVRAELGTGKQENHNTF